MENDSQKYMEKCWSWESIDILFVMDYNFILIQDDDENMKTFDLTIIQDFCHQNADQRKQGSCLEVLFIALQYTQNTNALNCKAWALTQ